MKVLTLFRHKRTLYIAGSVLLLAIAFTSATDIGWPRHGS